jgi:hypothetical protein
VTEKLNGLRLQRAGTAIRDLAVYFHANQAESVGYWHFFRHVGTSGWSPLCAPKRTSASYYRFMGSRPNLNLAVAWFEKQPNT